MGKYINILPDGTPLYANGKYEALERAGAQGIPTPESFSSVPEDKALICVVRNGPIDAAAWIYDEREFRDFTHPGNRIPRVWLLMDKETVERIAG